MRALVLAILLGFGLTLGVTAQPTVQPRPKTLVDFRSELGLTDQQVQTITSTLEQFKLDLKAYQDKLVANEKDFAFMLQQHADIEKLKSALRQSSDLGFQLQYLDVVTSRKVEATLTPEQLKKWHDIQDRLKAAKGK